jgi:hypothetical protein
MRLPWFYLLLAAAFFLLAAPAATALPIIQEVQPGVFTELYGVPGMSLDGWTLHGRDSAGDLSIDLDLTGNVIPLDGIFVIATIDLESAGASIQLLDPTDAVIDALMYGTTSSGIGEGTPAEAVGSGSSLSRDILGTDTNDNWSDFAELLVPTPGVGPAPIPEPTTALLLVTGLLGLATYRRGRPR